MSDRAFGELLREFRLAARLSQEELAERARLSPGAISTLERGARRAPQHQSLTLLVEALQLDDAERAAFEAAASAGRRRGVRAVSDDNTAKAHNLPNVLTSFRGRDAEVAELTRLMGSRRVITLLGPGGVGKTRLALEAARAQLDASALADGIWFVDFAPLGSPELVTTEVARVLGVREHPSKSLLDTLVAAIAAKRILLVLDNCEHLIDECARVTERLSRDCAHLVILATTREALRIDGECVVRVDPLGFEGTNGTAPALELLADRLMDGDHRRFSALTADDRAHVATICRRLDGIPLALELAAGRARDLPLAHIVAALDERFALLDEGRRTASPRQHTLRGMIDWSFALLSAGEQRLFACLGLFAGTFTAEAAARVCGADAPTLRDQLLTLSAKSLIAIVDDNGSLRYRLLETMRSYALERLRESGEEDAHAARFARYFTSVANQVDARYGRIANSDFLAAVERDLDNFRAALEWTLAHRGDTLLGAELAGSLGWVYRQTALFAEGTRWCERALAENPELPPAVAGRLHMALSFFAFNIGRMQPALDAAIAATASYRGAGAAGEISWALAQQAYCYYLLGDAAAARSAADASVDAALRQNDPLRRAGAFNARAVTIPIERATERFPALEEAIRYYRAAGDEGAIVPTANLAETHFAAGNFAEALSFGLEVVAMTRKNRDRSNLAAALTNAAAYALGVDDVAQADEAAREALTLVRPLGKTLNAMCALQHLGTVAARRGAFVRAARLEGASNVLYGEFGLTREFTEKSLYDGTIAGIRDALGDAALAEHLAAGAALPLDAAIDEAISGE